MKILEIRFSWKLFSFLFLMQLSMLTLLGMALFHVTYSLILFLFLYLFFQNPKYEWTIIDSIVSFYFGLRILSILISEYPALSQIAWTREVIFYPYYFIASWYLQISGENGLDKITNYIIIGGILTAIISILFYFLKLTNRAETIVAHYSTVATHLTFVIAILFAKMLSTQKKRFLFFSASLIIFLAIVLTLTRSAWIAAGVIFIFSMFKLNKLLMFISILIFSVFILSSSMLKERLFSFSNPEANDSGRSLLWKNASIAFKQKLLFGWGPESFNGINSNKKIYQDPNVETWHNEFLQNAVEGGIIIFFAYCSIYSISILTFLKVQNLKTLTFESYFLVFTILAFILGAFFSNLFRDILNGYYSKFYFATVSFLFSKTKNK